MRISRSHLFHVSLAFISLEHQLEAACKRYTCQAKRLALPAGYLFMDETSPRPKKRARGLNARFLRQLATRSFSSPARCGVRPTIFQLVQTSDSIEFQNSRLFHENSNDYSNWRHLHLWGEEFHTIFRCKSADFCIFEVSQLRRQSVLSSSKLSSALYWNFDPRVLQSIDVLNPEAQK